MRSLLNHGSSERQMKQYHVIYDTQENYTKIEKYENFCS